VTVISDPHGGDHLRALASLGRGFSFSEYPVGTNTSPCLFDLQADLGTTVVTRKRAEEYRRLAGECLILARKVAGGSPRATLIRMAQVWERLAVQQEEADPERSENRE
jgi:hypothetical protein